MVMSSPKWDSPSQACRSTLHDLGGLYTGIPEAPIPTSHPSHARRIHSHTTVMSRKNICKPSLKSGTSRIGSHGDSSQPTSPKGSKRSQARQVRFSGSASWRPPPRAKNPCLLFHRTTVGGSRTTVGGSAHSKLGLRAVGSMKPSWST